MSSLRVLVCGGRDYDDYQHVYKVLSEVNPALVISGGARGADSLAERWATEIGIPLIIMPAPWKAKGRPAGLMRNSWMLEFADPDMVIAFPGGRGTADIVRKAKGWKQKDLIIRIEKRRNK